MIDPAISLFLQSFFDKIFVITIERAKERQRQVATILQGIPFEFFLGVDKLTGAFTTAIANNVYDDNKAKQFNRVGKGMSAGEVACALSHRNLYNYIIEKGYNRVLIFEDDAVPLTENLSYLSAAINELPDNWDLVYFGYSKNEKANSKAKRKQLFYKILSSLRLIKWTPIMVKNFLPKPYSACLRKAGCHDLTHAFALSLKACQKIAAMQNPVMFNSDTVLSYLVMNEEINGYITKPQFFTQQMFIDKSNSSLIHT
jgi:glycosyl transferase, family 25